MVGRKEDPTPSDIRVVRLPREFSSAMRSGRGREPPLSSPSKFRLPSVRRVNLGLPRVLWHRLESKIPSGQPAQRAGGCP